MKINNNCPTCGLTKIGHKGRTEKAIKHHETHCVPLLKSLKYRKPPKTLNTQVVNYLANKHRSE